MLPIADAGTSSPGIDAGTSLPVADGGSSCPASSGPRIVRSFANPMPETGFVRQWASGLAWDGESLWAVHPVGQLFRIEPATGTARFAFALPNDLVVRTPGLAYLDGLLYVGGGQSASPVTVVDPTGGGVVRRLEGTIGLCGLAPGGDGKLWEANTLSGQVRRVRVADGVVLAEFWWPQGSGEVLHDLAAASGRLWAVARSTSRPGSRVVEIDAASGAALGSLPLPEANAAGLTHDGCFLWASGDEDVYQIQW